MKRTLEAITWITTLVACLVLLLGLADSPRRAATARAGVATGSSGARLCVRVISQATRAGLIAEVRVHRETEERTFVPAAELRTDARGQACAAELAPGMLWLLADAPGHARSSARLAFGEDGTHELVLAPATELAVRVEDELGAALPRATVLVSGSDPLPFGKLTDGAGSARFDRLPPAPWEVRAAAPGYESITRPGTRGDLTIALRKLAGLELRVVDTRGAAVAGASVFIAGPTLWPARRAQSDASGVARIRGLSAGSYDLRATHGNAVSAPVVGFELARGAEESLTLRLEPGRMITAVVTDGEGEHPEVVPGADVVLAEGGLSAFPLHGRSGADGKVTLGPIAPGPATLAARAPEFVGGPLVAVPEVLDGPLRVPLLRGGTLRGEVVDARGYPIAGAVVEVVGTDRYGLPVAETPLATSYRALHFEWSLAGPRSLIPIGELGVMPGPVPPIPRPGTPIGGENAMPSLLLDTPVTDVAPWVSGGNGEFVARPVTPGRVRALVRHPEYVEGASNLVVLGAGGEARVKVVLYAGGRLEGRVLDDRGFPVAGASVEAAADRGSFERSTSTEKDGSFAFAAVPAEVSISVARPEDPLRVALRQRAAVAEGKSTTLELVLAPPRAPVRIVIKDRDGAPVELAEVRVASLDPGTPLRATLFTDAAGAVEIDDALGLPLEIDVEAPRFAALEQSLPSAPAEVGLALEAGVLVSGQVTAVRGRRVVAGALVTLRAGTQRKSSMSDASGGFRFAGVAEGTAEISVSHPDYAVEQVTTSIVRKERADRAFDVGAIDLLEPGQIEGKVVDRDGRGVEGARVAIDVAPAYLPQGALPAGVSVTDASGSFVLSRVRPGARRVVAYAPALGRGSVDGVAVDAGRVAQNVLVRLSETDADAEPFASGGVAVTLGERGAGDAVEVVVVDVAPGSEADRSGLAGGDVISRIDAEKPRSMADARTRLAGRAGTDVVLAILRRGSALTLRVSREPVRR